MIVHSDQEVSKDQRGERNYKSLNKNRGKVKSHFRKRPNTLGPGNFDKMINRDTSQFMTIDHHQTDLHFYRRSTSQTTVPSHGIKITNTQNHLKYNDAVHQSKKKTKPMICCCDQIDSNLWIGNRFALDPHILKINDIKTVINFSSDQQKIDGIAIYNIDIADQRSIDYNTFLKGMRQGIELIMMIKKQDSALKILCVCDRGVNRSTCLLIYYGIIEKSMCSNQCLEYIEKSKYKYDRFWQSLTNLSMNHFLSSICWNNIKYNSHTH